MLRPRHYVLQGVAYLAFALFVGYFADSPTYTHMDPGQALIKLSFSHSGQRLQACRELSEAEFAKLPPSSRRKLDCPRGRHPVLVEVVLDGDLRYREEVAPSGLSGDGASSVYQRIPVAAGAHRVQVSVRDSARAEGFDYLREEVVTLKPRQIIVVDFRAEAGGLIFRQ